MKYCGLLLLLFLTLPGCAEVHGEYGCQGYPEGVSCKSAREVYALTDYNENLHKGQEAEDNQAAPTSAIPETVQRVMRQFKPDDPVPIRMPEQIMRIWVAPWEDKHGSLHMTSLIYTELEERRWVVGEKISNASPSLTPLDVRSRARENRNNNQPRDLSEIELTLPTKGE